jgi:hypothetical protein
MPKLNFSSNFGKLPSASASTATNTSNLSPELEAIIKAHNDDNAAYAQKYAMIDQMEKAGYPNMRGAYPNMMGQQGQFAPNFQGMYDNFGNDDYRVGRMGRGMRNMLPYMMFNPQNTYLQEFNAKKALFGPGARKVSMKFRTVFDPRTGQQVQVPVEGKGTAKDTKAADATKEQTTTSQRAADAITADYLPQRGLPGSQEPGLRYTDAMDIMNTPPPGTVTGANASYAPNQPAQQSAFPVSGGYNFNAQLEGDNSRFNFMPQRGMSLPGSADPNIRTSNMYRITPNMMTPNRSFAQTEMQLPSQTMADDNIMKGWKPKEIYAQSQLQPQRYGGMYEEGGIHELTEDEIQQIMAAGGSVTYLD